MKLLFTLITLVASVIAQEPGTITATTLAKLTTVLRAEGGDVFLPDNKEMYTRYGKGYDSVCTDLPKAIFLPATEAGLARALRAIRKVDADFVVATTRLNQNCLGTTTGYLINMRLFHTMEMEENNTRIRLGAGVTGDEANVFVESFGEYFVNSLMCTWGSVVGPILGGGYTWQLNPTFKGSMADNTLSLRFMDYKGEMYTVDSENNPDLFWALRGGGGQLGIITEVVMNVHKLKTMNQGSYQIPCPNGCDVESRLALMDRVGHWVNSLPGNVGAWVSFGIIPAGLVWVQCDYCDIEAMILADFPDATSDLPPPFTQFDKRRANMHETYSWIRARTNAIQGYDHDNSKGMTFEDNVASLGKITLTVSSWFMKEHHSDIIDVYREMFAAEDKEHFPNLVNWIVHLGDATSLPIDSAESNHKGAKIVWSTLSTAGSEAVYPVQNRLMPKVPGVMSQYWNYKNSFTSEEFTFTHNLKRIRAIRKKYDPEGVFALPEAKNEGSKHIDSCFAQYHCSGNGVLTEDAEFPTCACKCKEGWTGAMCDEVVEANDGCHGETSTKQLDQQPTACVHTNKRASGSIVKFGGKKKHRTSSPRACHTLCGRVEKCDAWAFELRSKTCRLFKDKAGKPVKFKKSNGRGVISGRKSEIFSSEECA